MDIVTFVNKYGFPVVAVVGIGYVIYYIWNWVTTVIKPELSEATLVVIELINRVRLLENDLIRLETKLETVAELRGIQYGKEHKQQDTSQMGSGQS